MRNIFGVPYGQTLLHESKYSHGLEFLTISILERLQPFVLPEHQMPRMA